MFSMLWQLGCVRLIVIGLVILCAGCGGSDSPTSPSTPPSQLAGTWAFTLQLTSASGGECVGADLQGQSLRDTGTLEISQNGASLTATLRSDLVGGACSYGGTATGNSFVLNLTGCDAGTVQVGYLCASGGIRDIEYTTNAINATVSGTQATGTSVETYNVNVGNTSTRVGVLTMNWGFTANKR